MQFCEGGGGGGGGGDGAGGGGGGGGGFFGRGGGLFRGGDGGGAWRDDLDAEPALDAGSVTIGATDPAEAGTTTLAEGDEPREGVAWCRAFGIAGA